MVNVRQLFPDYAEEKAEADCIPLPRPRGHPIRYLAVCIPQSLAHATDAAYKSQRGARRGLSIRSNSAGARKWTQGGCDAASDREFESKHPKKIGEKFENSTNRGASGRRARISGS